MDVVVTFPPDSRETTVLWYRARVERIPGIILRVRPATLKVGNANRTDCFAFHVSATYQG